MGEEKLAETVMGADTWEKPGAATDGCCKETWGETL